MPVVIVQGGEGKQNVFYHNVDAALTCIRQYDPGAYRRVQRYVTRIVGAELGGSFGWYWHNLRAVFLSPSYVVNTSPEALAMTLVHEAAHARIRQAGVRVGGDGRPRVEAVCIRAELHFARRVPGTDGLMVEASSRRQLELSKLARSRTAR